MPADEKGAVAVPREVYLGINAVRESGATNMLDRPRVAEIADEIGYPEAAEWIRSNRKAYAEGVFRGFAPEGGEAAPLSLEQAQEQELEPVVEEGEKP